MARGDHPFVILSSGVRTNRPGGRGRERERERGKARRDEARRPSMFSAKKKLMLEILKRVREETSVVVCHVNRRLLLHRLLPPEKLLSFPPLYSRFFKNLSFPIVIRIYFVEDICSSIGQLIENHVDRENFCGYRESNKYFFQFLIIQNLAPCSMFIKPRKKGESETWNSY